jgi:hypothetical protein
MSLHVKFPFQRSRLLAVVRINRHRGPGQLHADEQPVPRFAASTHSRPSPLQPRRPLRRRPNLVLHPALPDQRRPRSNRRHCHPARADRQPVGRDQGAVQTADERRRAEPKKKRRSAANSRLIAWRSTVMTSRAPCRLEPCRAIATAFRIVLAARPRNNRLRRKPSRPIARTTPAAGEAKGRPQQFSLCHAVRRFASILHVAGAIFLNNRQGTVRGRDYRP